MHTPIDPSTTLAWTRLTELAPVALQRGLRQIVSDPDRGPTQFTAADITLDVSKQYVEPLVLQTLVELADACDVAGQRDAMFAGQPINVTEHRSVLHTALRQPSSASVTVDGTDVVSEVHGVLDRMARFATSVRDGDWVGATGERIRSVVNIGIGGSDLGPAMVTQALTDYADPDITTHFVSNIDPVDLATTLAECDPASTLFVVVSKTFTTAETMSNAQTARGWLVAALGEPAVARHFVAVSTNTDEVVRFGIDEVNVFGFWDWVGGRYSVTSAVGLSTMIAIGPEAFGELLAGCHDMDEHFRSAPTERNLPMLMGLISVWNRNFLGIQTTAVLPYSQLLARFPAYLQQLVMESNGKSVRSDGASISYDTSAIYWGEPGTNGQHSFYQLLHQGTALVAADFIIPAKGTREPLSAHEHLVANALAQSAVLAFGKTAEELAADGTSNELIRHKVMPGGRPSSTIMFDAVRPYTLGALIAVYEHATFTQGAVWGINSFDQWGVELGKQVAAQIVPELQPRVPLTHDASTNALIELYRELLSD